MERFDINLLIDKTQKTLYNGVIDSGGPIPAKVEIQKLKGNDGKIYTLSILIESPDAGKSQHE